MRTLWLTSYWTTSFILLGVCTMGIYSYYHFSSFICRVLCPQSASLINNYRCTIHIYNEFCPWSSCNLAPCKGCIHISPNNELISKQPWCISWYWFLFSTIHNISVLSIKRFQCFNKIVLSLEYKKIQSPFWNESCCSEKSFAAWPVIKSELWYLQDDISLTSVAMKASIGKYTHMKASTSRRTAMKDQLFNRSLLKNLDRIGQYQNSTNAFMYAYLPSFSFCIKWWGTF